CTTASQTCVRPISNVRFFCSNLYIPYFGFFFNANSTYELYTLSLHDALPISMKHVMRSLIDQTLQGLLLPIFQQQRLCVEKLGRSEEHTSELQSRENLVCRLLLEKKKPKISRTIKPNISHQSSTYFESSVI